MPRFKSEDQLGNLIDSLRRQRREHEQAIEVIDATFARYGITAGGAARPGRRPGRPPGSKNKVAAGKPGPKPGKAGKRGRKRGSFPISGDEDVLNFVRGAGKPSTAEVNAHWKKQGRGGKADNTLTKLVKDGKLKRINVKGERGSRYQVA